MNKSEAGLKNWGGFKNNVVRIAILRVMGRNLWGQRGVKMVKKRAHNLGHKMVANHFIDVTYHKLFE